MDDEYNLGDAAQTGLWLTPIDRRKVMGFFFLFWHLQWLEHLESVVCVFPCVDIT
jgi:hypothetical protein